MSTDQDLVWQPSLLEPEAVAIDGSFARLERVQLDATAWVDYVPEWLSGADTLFEELVETRNWGQRTRQMYDKEVIEPRLTAPWRAGPGKPLEPPILEEARVALSERYGVEFDSVGFNFYRDGRDSVAWHRDRIPKEVDKPLVALLSVGQPRRFLLRPYGGGKSRAYMLGRGDLLVTGGETQRTWEHSVPKVAAAGPRISIAFRHGMRKEKSE